MLFSMDVMRRTYPMILALILLLLLAPSCGSGDPPVEGATVFRERCAACHGQQGEGNMGPALQGQVTETIVREGRLPQGMPAFENELSDAEIEAVVAYANTLNR
jgi:mono/diheme cytochrome c family protein